MFVVMTITVRNKTPKLNAYRCLDSNMMLLITIHHADILQRERKRQDRPNKTDRRCQFHLTD